MFDQIADNILRYDQAAKNGLRIKETGNKKTIIYNRQFTTNEKALALSIFIYKPTNVTIIYHSGEVESYNTTTTIFAKDMPHTLVDGKNKTIKFITWGPEQSSKQNLNDRFNRVERPGDRFSLRPKKNSRGMRIVPRR